MNAQPHQNDFSAEKANKPNELDRARSAVRTVFFSLARAVRTADPTNRLLQPRKGEAVLRAIARKNRGTFTMVTD